MEELRRQIEETRSRISQLQGTASQTGPDGYPTVEAQNAQNQLGVLEERLSLLVIELTRAESQAGEPSSPIGEATAQVELQSASQALKNIEAERQELARNEARGFGRVTDLQHEQLMGEFAERALTADVLAVRREELGEANARRLADEEFRARQQATVEATAAAEIERTRIEGDVLAGRLSLDEAIFEWNKIQQGVENAITREGIALQERTLGSQEQREAARLASEEGRFETGLLSEERRHERELGSRREETQAGLAADQRGQDIQGRLTERGQDVTRQGAALDFTSRLGQASTEATMGSLRFMAPKGTQDYLGELRGGNLGAQVPGGSPFPFDPRTLPVQATNLAAQALKNISPSAAAALGEEPGSGFTVPAPVQLGALPPGQALQPDAAMSQQGQTRAGTNPAPAPAGTPATPPHYEFNPDVARQVIEGLGKVFSGLGAGG